MQNNIGEGIDFEEEEEEEEEDGLEDELEDEEEEEDLEEGEEDGLENEEEDGQEDVIEIQSNEISEIDETKSNINFFYQTDISKLAIQFVYIDKNNEIIHIKKQRVKLSEKNKILKEQFVGLVSKNFIYDNTKYKLQSVLKYNIDIPPEKIKFLKEYSFFSIIKNIGDIYFKNSIGMFHSLNALTILFREQEKINTPIRTKKNLQIKKSHVKTARKEYKEN